MLRCPLCLSDLSKNRIDIAVGLGRAQKISHITPDEIPAFLQKHKDLRFEALRKGPLVRHRGCAALHPYYSVEDRPPIPAKEQYAAKSGTIQVDHWLLARLRDLVTDREHYVLNDLEKEMWYPLALFLAVNPDGFENPVRGASIKLSGAKDAGKSLLSTMLVLPAHYLGHHGVRAGSTIRTADNYVYASPELGLDRPQTPFVGAFAPLCLLTKEKSEATYTEPTRKLTSNVRSLIFREGAANQGGNVSVFGALITSLLGRGQADIFCLTIYDTAGEQAQGLDIAMDEIDRHVDVSVVVMDATRMPHFGWSGDVEVLNAALDQLQTAVQQGLRTCLVMTKLDIVPHQDGQLASLMQRIVSGNLNQDGDHEKDMTLQWLRRQGHRPAERKLAEILSSHPEIAVRFVWTAMDQLEWKNRATPPTFGIQRLVRWCLTTVAH